MSKLQKNPINILILLSSILSIFFYVNFNRGIELSDESYLLLISLFPSEVFGRVNNSGIIGSFLLELSNFNIFYFRITGALLLLIGSLFLLNPIINFNIKVLKLTTTKKNYLILLFILGSLNYYQNWVITPSYDLYNLLGIIIFINGLLRLYSYSKDKFYFSILLILIGGLLTFICKPTTTLFLVIIYIVWILYFFNIKKFIFILSVSTISSILIFYIYIYIFFGSWNFFLNDILLGIELKTLLDPRYSIFYNFLSTIKQIIFYYYTNVIYLISFLFGILFFRYINKKYFNSYLFILIFLPLLIENNFLLSLFFIIFFYLCFDVHLSNLYKIKKKEMNFIFFNFILIFLLYAFVVGTNTNVIILIQKASIILFFIIFNIVEKFRFNKIFIFEKMSIFFIILFLSSLVNTYNNFEKPRRYQSKIFNQNQKLKLDRFNGFIYVDNNTLNFINEFKKILKKNEWKKNNYLIDFTGREPGLNLVSGAKFISDPWWASAYVGSEKKAKKLLSLSNIDYIKNAWIVTTDFKVRINPNVLETVGLNINRNFKLVGKLKKQNKNYFIWRPIF